MDRYRIIASVDKPRGAKGEVVCCPVDGLPLLLHTGMKLWIVPPALRGPRQVEVRSTKDGPRGQQVRLSGVDDLSLAEKIAGRYLLAREADLPDDLLLHDPQALVGLEVADVSLGDLGSITAVMSGPAQDVWEIQGPYGTVLVPAVPEFLVRVDGDHITMDLPSGLVEASQ